MIRLRLPSLDALIVTLSQVENRLAKQSVLCTCLCFDIMSLMIYSQSKKLQSKVTLCSWYRTAIQSDFSALSHAAVIQFLSYKNT